MSFCIKKRFWKLYFTVAATAVVLLFIGFGIFWGFIASHETAQPATFAARYAAGLSSDDLANMLENSLSAAVSPYENADDVHAAHLAALSALDGEVTVRKKFLSYTAEKPVFFLLKGDTVFAEITLAPAEAGAFRLRRWEVQSSAIQSTDWAPRAVDYTVCVPKNAALTINGVPVPPEAITETDTAYGLTSAYVPDGTVFWDVYVIPGMYGTPEMDCSLNGENCAPTQDGTAVNFRYPESMMQTYTLTVPADADSLVNGVKPAPENITAKDIRYEYSPLEADLTELPTAVTYQFSDLFAPPKIEVTLQETPLSLRENDGAYTADYPASHLYTCTVHAPEGSAVTIYGKDCSLYKTGTEPVFQELTKWLPDMPSYDVYTVTGLYASPEKEVRIEREGELIPLTVTVNSFDVQCTAKFPKATNPILDDLAAAFLINYIKYTGSGYSGIDENLAEVLAYVLTGSDAYTRIKNSREAIRFVTPVQKTTYKRQEIVSSVKYADDLWEYAVEFDIEQNTAGYLREYAGTFHLIFATINGEWKVADMKIVAK